MDVIFAILCDAANISQEGKLNILGSFANISATTFPIRHPEMHLVIRMEASPAEVGMQKKIEVTIMDEDGNKVSGFGADLVVPPQKKPGEPAQMVAMLRMVDTVFPKKGRYAVYVLIDGKTETHIPLSVGG
jgi:hypothetical protein